MGSGEPRILYVEDEADIREVAEFALEDEGFEVLFCADGAEALERVLDFAPDLILLDVMMPILDGPSTLLEIRKIPSLAEVPVAFLTAKVQSCEVNDFLALGALEVIAKPFDPMILPDQIRELLARAKN